MAWALVMLLVLPAGFLAGQNRADDLQSGFQTPPDSSRPRVWWHWMSGNITKEGIKADLEWMKRSGIAGFQNFDAGLNTPQIVERRLVYMTPEWKEAFRYAATLADQLGLEMAIAGSPGWSESGGPWVTPAQAMKKFVWSETLVEGGQPFRGILPRPPSVAGPYQNQTGGRGFAGMGGGAPAPPPEFYADSAVVACRRAEAEDRLAAVPPKVSASGGSFTLQDLTDGDLAKTTLLPSAPVDQKAWIQVEYPTPQTIRGLTWVTAAAGRGFGRSAGPSNQALEAGDDGQQFRTVAEIPVGARTMALPPVTARFFRITVLTTPPPAGRGGIHGVRPRVLLAPAGAPGGNAGRGTCAARRYPGQPVPGQGRLFRGDRHLRHGHTGRSRGRRHP